MSEINGSPQPGAEHLTDLDFMHRVLGLLTNGAELQVFAKGYRDGTEAADYAARQRDAHSYIVASPISDITAMPAWPTQEYRALTSEGHSLIRGLGAVIGAFAERAGIDLDEALEERAHTLSTL